MNPESQEDAAVRQLMQLYEQSGGRAPGNSELQALFDNMAVHPGTAAQKQTDAEAETIYPTPRFVVKSTDGSGRKVFVNMCSSDKVAAPAAWAGGVLPDHIKHALEQNQGLDSIQDADALRIPLSLSEMRTDVDKHGEPCVVFDCVFSLQVMDEASMLRSMKVFVIETTLGWINHKHKLEVDLRFKLPKLRYKGDTVHAHRIRKDPKQLVTEVDEVQDDVEDPALPLVARPVPAEKRARALAKLNAKESSKENQPSAHQQEQVGQHVCAARAEQTEARVLGLEYVGKPCTHVIGRVQLPSSRAYGSQDVQVRAGVDAIHVAAVGCAPLAMATNVFVKPQSCRCELDGHEVKVVAELIDVDELTAVCEAQRPLPLGSIALQSASFAQELD